MPRTKSGAGPGQVRGKTLRGPGQIPLFSIFFRPCLGQARGKLLAARAGPEQALSGLGQVRSKPLAVRGRSGASPLAGTRHGFVQNFQKSRQNGLATDGRGVVVKLSGSLATPYSMASLLKYFQFSEPNPPLTFPLRQTFSTSDRPFIMH